MHLGASLFCMDLLNMYPRRIKSFYCKFIIKVIKFAKLLLYVRLLILKLSSFPKTSFNVCTLDNPHLHYEH